MLSCRQLYFHIAPPIDHPEDKANEIRSYVNGHDRVWLLFAETHFDFGDDVANFTINTLNESYAISYKEHYEISPHIYPIYDVYLFKRMT